jgi:hypothetical protein
MTGIKFYGSQVGAKSQTFHTTSIEPISLLYHDILAALKSAPYIPYIFWPLRPALSRDLCELAPTWANLWACFLHLVLLIMQIPFIISIPLWVFFPVWTVLLGGLVFLGLNNLVIFLLNGSKKEFHSESRFAAKRKEHEGEQWVFMNGVAAGYVYFLYIKLPADKQQREHWLQRNIDRIALTFGRPVIGLHNKT